MLNHEYQRGGFPQTPYSGGHGVSNLTISYHSIIHPTSLKKSEIIVGEHEIFREQLN